MITRRNANFWWDIMRPRDRKPYGYGGRWDRNDTNVTTDCSGIVSNCLEALVRGPDGFDWDREPYSTESWRVVQVGEVGPFGTICVNRPEDIPASAAVRIGCQHGGGGRNSHMACTVYDPVVGTINVESSGTNGQRMGGPARGYNDGLFHDWHYLPGPIEGGVAPPPPTNAADVLARATGISLNKAIDLLPRVSFALVKSNCNNPRRIAAALAQWVIESGHFVYTEEIASGPESEERWKYKGRTWIQLTWLENYRGFGNWCHSIGLVPYGDYFVDRPKELAEQKWAALGPAYWWAIKYPQINEYADRGDIDNVSKWVNAPAWVGDPNKHANHEKERRDAYNKALALGDQLLSLVSAAPPSGEDELSAEAERKIAEIHAKQFDSFSMYAVGPRKVPQAEAYGWDQRVESSALRGEDWALSLVRQAGDGTLFGVLRDGKPDQFLVEHARAVYREAVTTPADAPVTVAKLATSPQVVEKIVYRDPPPAPVALPEIVYLPAPIPDVEVPAYEPPKSPGQLIGQAYDALQQLRLADALPIEDRAPLAALIAVLQTKNGSQI